MIPSAADLGYFVEIASTLNVSRAAERLGISQPSLSLAMQRLELEVGTPLLIRSKRGVTLTKAGQQLLAHTRHLQETWENIKTQTLASAQDIQGSYSIGCHASVGLNSLSSILPALMMEHPKLDLRLKHDLSRKVAEDIISLKTDIGIVVNPVHHPDLVIHPLCKDEVTLWTAAGKQKPLQDIAGGSAVLVCDPDLLQSQSLFKQLRKKSMVFARTIPSGNLEVIADLVANGCGIGILPAQVAMRARKKLVRIQNAPIFYDDHCLIYRVENKGVKSIQVLVKAIRQFFDKTP